MRANAPTSQSSVHEQLADEQRIVLDEALQPTDIRPIECDDPNLRHVPTLAKAGDLAIHVEVQLLDGALHSLEIQTRAVIEVFWARRSENGPRGQTLSHGSACSHRENRTR